MARTHRFTFPLPNGLHARPASHLEAFVARFVSAVSLVNERNGQRADVRSVLGLISADVRAGDPCALHLEGADEADAVDTVAAYLAGEFLRCDEALPVSAVTAGGPAVLPRALVAAGVTAWRAGRVVNAGLARGRLVLAGRLALAPDFTWPAAASPDGERARVAEAFSRCAAQLAAEAGRAAGQEREVLRAHAALLRDPAYAAEVEAQLAGGAGVAGVAIFKATETFSEKLRAGSAYLRERVADLQDLAARLIIALHGEAAVVRVPILKAPAIVCAAELTPGQFLALDRRQLFGLVLENAGDTSHTVILARAAGLPLLVGAEGASALPDGVDAVLDARRGVLVLAPVAGSENFYRRELAREAAVRAALDAGRHEPARGADGEALAILANVASAAEVASAVERGAEGVGLFRTELLFMGRDAAPTEDEQFDVYRAALVAAGGRPLVIRTLDIGGDKPVPYLQLPTEPNPFLGLRGVRLHGRLAALIRSQLRALLRASAHGPLRIMVPMVACVEEMVEFRDLVGAIAAELRSEGVAVGDGVMIGAMIEIPSAVFAIPELAAVADFFSVGSNDLAQYFLAADRDNAATAALGTWRHPAFLRLLRQAVDAAHAAGRPIGLCGDLAGRSEALPLSFGLGFDSISLGAAGVSAAKAALGRLTRAGARARLERCLAARDRVAVGAVLAEPVDGAVPALLDPALLEVDCDAATKAEVINELVARVAASGRTADAPALEEAVWAREAAYATNFGHGFAVPHCQTSLVKAPVIALARLRVPVEWSADAAEGVRVALLLIMPAGENRAHLKIFSRLSRLIMREEFRAALEAAADAEALRVILAGELAEVAPA